MHFDSYGITIHIYGSKPSPSLQRQLCFFTHFAHLYCSLQMGSELFLDYKSHAAVLPTNSLSEPTSLRAPPCLEGSRVESYHQQGQMRMKGQ